MDLRFATLVSARALMPTGCTDDTAGQQAPTQTATSPTSTFPDADAFTNAETDSSQSGGWDDSPRLRRP